MAPTRILLHCYGIKLPSLIAGLAMFCVARFDLVSIVDMIAGMLELLADVGSGVVLNRHIRDHRHAFFMYNAPQHAGLCIRG